MNKQEVASSALGRIVLMDSIAQLTPEDAGSIVIAASHGGTSAAQFALAVPLRLAVFNDAGVGKDDAGIAALGILQAQGVAAATVAHTSARIGDSRDMWTGGVLSHVNQAAQVLGLRAGQVLRTVLTGRP